MSYKQKNVIAIKRHSRIILSKEGIKEFFMKKSKEYVGIVLTFIVTLMLMGYNYLQILESDNFFYKKCSYPV